MADEEQIKIFVQGVDAWNNWRSENLYAEVDLSNGKFHANFPDLRSNEANFFEANLISVNLSGANLSGFRLSGANFRDANLKGSIFEKAYVVEANFERTNLSEANFEGANLSGTNFEGARLDRANFKGAILKGANLRMSNLTGASFKGANLEGANLDGASLIAIDCYEAELNKVNFSNADLSESNLRLARLRGANLFEVKLHNADLSHVNIGNTIFTNVDLSETRGLKTVQHVFSSTIGVDTLQLSKGKIPDTFLRGCGLPDWEIESAKLYTPDLNNEGINKIIYKIYDLRATQALQISPLFISYSHADSTFVDRLEKGLNKKGVRFWRDIHDMTAGKIETQIDRAIRQNPTVLLILSKNIMNSDWVQHEVRKARELEKELRRDTLCPIALDDSWRSNSWPQRVMEQVREYNILDFSNWDDEAIFNYRFAKLLSGLDLFYKKPEA